MRLTLAAFGREIPLAGYLLLVAASYLSFAIPAVPGALGVFEALVKTSLVAGFALDPATALGYALTLHFMLVAPISVLGSGPARERGPVVRGPAPPALSGTRPAQTTDAHAGQ